MIQGSKGHDFSCKHENHDLLTLASYNELPDKSGNL